MTYFTKNEEMFNKMNETKEKCPVCKTECENGTTICSVCRFTYEPKIDMAWPIPEDAKNWIEAVVKPYRVQWEAKKREAELLAQIEELKKREAKLSAQVENAKKQKAENTTEEMSKAKALEIFEAATEKSSFSWLTLFLL